MELVPENFGGAVVFNVHNSCCANKSVCGNCAEFAVAIHNWILTTEIRYVMIDLQDEKEVCPVFLEELLQLAKRLRFPFVFAGVMDKARRMLESYDFLTRSPIFVTPEEAVAALEAQYPGITRVETSGVQFGVPIAQSRPRNGMVADDISVEAEEGA